MLKAFPKRLVLVTAAALLLLIGCGGQMDTSDDGSGAPQGDGQAIDDGRKIVRIAEVDLAIENLDTALRDIRSIAGDADGFVSESDIVVDSSDDPQVARPERAAVTIRVPVSEYEAVMERLRGIATGVDSERSSVLEVTEQFTDLQARLNNLQAAEAGYLDLLAKAETIDEILRVQEFVNSTRGEIEQVQGQLNVLNSQADLATITINLRLAAVPASGGNWASNAWQASWNASEDTAVVLGTMAIAGAVISLWVIPVLVVAYLVWRRFGSRIAALAKKLN